MINKISDNKFGDGGAAILTIENKNHHKVIRGKYLCKPLIKNSLRVDAVRYSILASAKSPEEQRPCAILIRRAPSHPQ